MSTACTATDASPLGASAAQAAAPRLLARRGVPLIARGASDACQCNTSLYRPTCPEDCANCVERLIALPCGRSCPDNYCLPDPPSSTSSTGAKIGGGIGGAIGAVALVVLGLCVWRVRNLRRARAAAHAREEARLRAIVEKTSPRSRRGPFPPSLRSSEDDVEYTILRRDGLTTYEEDLLPPPPVHGGERLSISAATHLSRISERTEDHAQLSPLPALPPWTEERYPFVQRDTCLPSGRELSLRGAPSGHEDVIIVGPADGVRSFRSLATGATGSSAASQSTFPIPVIDTSPASNTFAHSRSDDLPTSPAFPAFPAHTHDPAS